MKAIEILKHYPNSVVPITFSPKAIFEAIQELEENEIDRNLAQKLFIEQDLKHKKEIKMLKIKFIEDIAYLKKDLL